MRVVILFVAALVGACSGLMLSPRFRTCAPAADRRAWSPACNLDYNDPDVSAEMQEVQAFDTEELADELALSGIPAPPTMNDFELRMMLVELRLRKKGKMGATPASPPKPASYGNDFEKALYEKPAFKLLFDDYRKMSNINAVNLATEHLINPRQAKERYGGTATYDKTIAEIEASLTAKVVQVVKSAKLYFAGFPSNMGESAVKMTLGTFGELLDFSCEESDDGMTLTGRAEYDSIDAAKSAIDKYDGVDMGLGNTLELQSL